MCRFKLVITLSFLWLLLSGCAHNPTRLGVDLLSHGAHAITIGPNNIKEIAFSSNVKYRETYDKVQMYAFYYCAKYTKQHGKKYFVMYPSLLRAAFDKPLRQPAVFTVVRGDIKTGYADVYMLDKSRAGAYNADEVLAYLKNKVKDPNPL